MTPTKAIRHLGALSAFANADEVKAVEMAIEALKDYEPTLTFYDPNDPSVPPVAIKNRLQVEPRITRNAIECGKCGDVIESKHPHDYKACKCGGCIVDGGLERLARSGGNFIERSEWG